MSLSRFSGATELLARARIDEHVGACAPIRKQGGEQMTHEKRVECDCEDCQSLCENTPGWFLPGEAEKAAQLKGLTLREFFERFLTVDYWVGKEGGNSVFVLRPATVDEEPGGVAPIYRRGTCVFLTEDRRCGIHEAKPHECAVTRGCAEKPSENPRLHYWPKWNQFEGRCEIERATGTANHQVPTPTILDLLDLLAGRL